LLSGQRLQAADQILVQLHGKRHQPGRLIELALFAAVQHGASGLAEAARDRRQLHSPSNLHSKGFYQVGFFHVER